MSRIREIIGEYLAVRRSLGYTLRESERMLLCFAAFLEDAPSSFVTTDLAVKWAIDSEHRSTNSSSMRLGVVRSFARFAKGFDPRTEIPPAGYLPYRVKRPVPYIYSVDEIHRLVNAVDLMRSPPFSKATFSTLIGLISVTGMRLGEAIALDRDDFAPRKGIITIRKGKFGKSRELVLHQSAQDALCSYEKLRDIEFPKPLHSAFFLSRKGKRLFRQNVSQTFDIVRRRAGLADQKPRRPHIHDLRHTFAVHTLTDWYRDGLDVESRLPLLSTYLGHVSPSSTYWYLTVTPELAELAAKRMEQKIGDLP